MNACSMPNGTALGWLQWQVDVVGALRADLTEVLQKIDLGDIDWDVWRNFYNEGRSPRAAVDRALEQDL